MMSVDLSVKDLAPYLPHRPPMVWVDKITALGGDYKKIRGICRIQIDSNALYISERSQINGSAAVEFTAQAFGYLKAAYQVTHNFHDAPTQTYLTGVRSCKADFSTVNVDSIRELQVEIEVVREILPLTMVRGIISNPDTKEIYAETEIQVYVDYPSSAQE